MEPAFAPIKRIVVLASGSGSNLQALIDASVDGALASAAEIVAVVSDRGDSYALERATLAEIPAIHLPIAEGEARTDYDTRLAATVADHQPDLIVLAGWMRLLSMTFLSAFPHQVVNLHPARPGELPGTRAIERAWHEALAGQRTSSGVMVHLVPDEGVDDGPVLATEDVPIHLDDTFETFAARLHSVEHRLLVDTIRTLCDQDARKEIHA